MDFITGLPLSQVKTVLFVVVCRLSKYAYFIPMKHPYVAASVAQIFFKNIFQHHGLPKSIVPYQDDVFLCMFWQELFRLQDTSFNMSYAYCNDPNLYT